MATRAQVIEWIKGAAAQGDLKTCTRLFCENRISRAAYDDAVHAGQNRAAWCAKNAAARATAQQVAA